MKKNTKLIHQKRIELLNENKSLISPIYQSVKFSFPSIEEGLKAEDTYGNQFEYSRVSNPTVRELELMLADLQDKEDSICVSSGMASIWLSMLGNLKSGDCVLYFLESYQPTRVMLKKFLRNFGIESIALSIRDFDSIKNTLSRKEVKMLIFESPTNPMLQIPDIEKLVFLAKENSVITIMDNTWAGLHNHGQFGIDYFIHSLTKYASGHGDVMGGAVISSSKNIKKIKPLAVNMGSILDPATAYLIMRGLKTYHLRVDRHETNAFKIANFLKNRSEVKKVFYPGLEDDDGYNLAKKQMKSYGGVVTFHLDCNKDKAWNFINSLKLFTTASSLGSPESLVIPAHLFFTKDFNKKEISLSGIQDSTIRLSLGLEDIDDLIFDLSEAFDRIFKL
tara:strand:- start:851 stop:2026 length:1176 start_codon:yes stop_codon:yes gene_type:complete